MPKLTNARHERFAQELAKGKSATEAYELAGFSTNRGNAVRMKANESVAARVDELKGRAAKKVEVTLDSLTAELEQARGIALKERQSSAAVQATMGKAKLFGLGVENRRLSGAVTLMTITPQMLDGLLEDELAALERAFPVLEKLGLIGSDPGPAAA